MAGWDDGEFDETVGPFLTQSGHEAQLGMLLIRFGQNDQGEGRVWVFGGWGVRGLLIRFGQNDQGEERVWVSFGGVFWRFTFRPLAYIS